MESSKNKKRTHSCLDEVDWTSFFTSFESEQDSGDSDDSYSGYYSIDEENEEKTISETSNTTENISALLASLSTPAISSDHSNTNDDSCSVCPICLHSFQDRSYLDTCYHSFCVSCIRTWLSISSKCPLCKSKIEFIIHDINESNGTFQKFYVGDSKDYTEIHRQKLKRRKWIMEISNEKFRNIKSESKKQSSSSSSSEVIIDRIKIYNKNLLAKNVPQCKKRSHDLNYDRIRPFISRDLKAILSDAHDQIIEEHIQSIIMTYYKQRKSKDEIIKKLKPWLGGSTEKFLNETFLFIESCLKIDQWDKLVTYSEL
ncbi:26326_t:CDS:1 [Dentiscutata erythropus]|uniref:RING-type E3 ubiquitin transferase n=1 Tax=Dentiscutata erythropus TaxID=1348616 RepID=A0A9N9JI39_9GLOM|nr:26326_t:CDS:1 [Dentiscutata erythropus]